MIVWGEDDADNDDARPQKPDPATACPAGFSASPAGPSLPAKPGPLVDPPH